MPAPRQVFVAVIGVGGVGKAFLSQLSALSTRLSQSPSGPIYLSLVLLARSKKHLYHDNYLPIPLSSWEQDLAASDKPTLGIEKIADFLGKAPHKTILVDNTSDLAVAEAYPLFLKGGVSIVTPNKKGFSGSYELWKGIFDAAANGPSVSGASGGYVFHESTVGAGLPVISTLKELVETGDEVQRIEGVFSGTMSFLFNNFMPVGGGGGQFSAEVTKAKESGYTEPDPRDDLNGMDVARKLTILARLAGLPVEGPTAFPVESLIPKELEAAGSADEYMRRLPEFDGEMDKLKQAAAAEGKVVRYVGSIDIGKKDVKVGLEKFDTSHPIAALKGSDNIIAFYTKRYGSNPLIIQGAGAGGDVTAMGVTGDLIKVLKLIQ